MRATRWNLIRRIMDRLSPRLFPGNHRYCELLDGPPMLASVTDPAAFDRMAARMAGTK